MELKTNAFIIKKINWKESSQIIHAFNDKFGFCSFIAKGIRKDKHSDHEIMQLFNEVELILSVHENSELSNLKSASLILANLNNNFKTIAIKTSAIELLQNLIINPEDLNLVYTHLKKFFIYLENNNNKQIYHFVRFCLSLLDIIGEPFLKIHCDLCHSESNKVIAYENNGTFYCEDCSKYKKNLYSFDPDLMNIIYNYQNYWSFIDQIEEKNNSSADLKKIIMKQYMLHFNKSLNIKALDLL